MGAILAAFGAGMVAGGLILLRVQPRRPLVAAVAASLLFVAPLVLLGYAIAGVLAGALGIAGTLWLAAGVLVAATAPCLAVPAVSGLRAPPRQVQEPIGGPAR